MVNELKKQYNHLEFWQQQSLCFLQGGIIMGIYRMTLVFLLIMALTVGVQADSLHEAVKKRDIETVRLLIKTGADLNAWDRTDGWTPLHMAVYHGYTDIAEILVNAGANVDGKDQYNNAPLHYGALLGRKDTVRLLIDKGADVNIKGSDGIIPLHSAISKDHLETAKLLIEKGSNVNFKADDGDTPLHTASAFNCLRTAKLLIEKGAHVNAKTREGETPLYFAIKNGHNEMAGLLRRHGAKSQ